ncbi:MAG: Ig-like domain-containing protein [Crocosphaera sp.]|nr:Ig-like domain-containing protein [Crocosphaera sp.]
MDGAAFNPANPFDASQGAWRVDENGPLQENPRESVGSVPEILPPLNDFVSTTQANMTEVELFPLQLDSNTEEDLSSSNTTIDILTGTETTFVLTTFLAEEIPLAQTEPIFGDADLDGDADNDDLNVILASRNTPASGSDDPRDLDGDGQITVLDARGLILLLGSNTDFESPVLSASLGNDTAVNGTSNNDGITFDPLIQGTLTDVSQVTRFLAGFNETTVENYTDILGVLAEEGSFSLTPGQLAQINGGSLAEGEQTLHLFAKDQWGNESTFDVTYTLDTIAPDTPLVNVLDGDSVTNDNTPTLEITAEVGSTVKLLQDGDEIAQLTASEEGKVEFTLDSLADGTYEFTATATDIAGNVSDASAPLTLEIDTTAPPEPIFGLDETSDTGTLGDLETNLETVTLVGETEANAIVELLGTEQSTTADETGQFQFTEVALVVGENSLTVTATDAAGNVSQSSQTITRVEDGDITPPAPPILDLLASSDSGSSNSDNITNDNTPTIEITAEVGSLVELFQNGSKVGENTANDNGIAQFTLDSLADGIYDLTATATDAAGNVSDASAPLTLEIDTTVPPEPIFGLDETSDTGTLGDLETNLETVTLVGETEANAIVELLGTGQTTTADETGQFQFSDVALVVGENSFTVIVTDAAGNVSQSSQTITRIEAGDTTPPSPPILDLLASSDSGSSNSDNVTNDNTPTIEITAEVGSLVELFQNGSKVGENTPNENGIAQFTLDSLADGTYNLTATATDAAGNMSETSAPLTIVIDKTRPNITITSPMADAEIGEGDQIVGTVNETLASLRYRIDGRLPGNNVTLTNGTFAQDINLTGVGDGDHTITLTGTDLAGNVQIETIEVTVNQDSPLVITGFNPQDGAVDVGVTVRAQVFFSEAVDINTLNDTNFFARSAGRTLATTVVAGDGGRFAWLFLDEPMPSASVVEVTVDGSTIMPLDGGAALDADGDGQAGGKLTFDFKTVSLEPIPNTTLSGIVADPGPDQQPMTADDFDPGLDGIEGTEDDVFLLPIVGAEVFIVGRENETIFTDENGRFFFESVPVGNVKVEINGLTATSAPDGFYFPEMVMDVNTEAGVENFVMAGQPQIYLPRLPDEILQTVQADETTMIVADEVSAPELTEEEQPLLTLEIQPNSLLDSTGEVMTEAQIGISTVPPELVRDMLPPGVLQHTFDITIQAPGITRFAEPAPMTFPNVFNAAPGTQLNFLSFSHETGRLEIVGTATVDPTGEFVRTDPGTGITQPGWHGLTPPGGCGGSGGPPPMPPEPSDDEEETIHDPVALNFITGESATNFMTMEWMAPPENPNSPSLPPIPGCNVPTHNPDDDEQQPFINVTIEIDGPLKDFMKPVMGGLPLESQGFTLSPGTGDTKKFGFQTKSYDELFGAGGFINQMRDKLYGSQIKITVVEQKTDGTRTRDIFTFYQNRWVNVIDAEQAKNKTGNTAAFHRTLTDGFVRTKNVDYFLPNNVSTSFDGPLLGSPFDLGGSLTGNGTAVWEFDPFLSGDRSDTFDIEVDDPNTFFNIDVGEIVAKGKATNPTTIDVNLSGYKTELKRVLQSLNRLPGPDMMPMTADDVIQYSFVGGRTRNTSAQFNAQFAGFLPGNVFTDAQLNTKLDQEANALLAAVQADYNLANNGTGVTGYEIGSFFFPDVTMVWEDSFLTAANNINTTGMGSPIYGFADFDRNTAFLQNHIATPLQISDAAKQWALAEGLNPNVSNDGSFSVAINTSWTSGATFAEFVANTVSHEIGHTFGLLDAYLFAGGNTPPNDIMRAGSNADGDLTFAAQNLNLLRAALGMHTNGDKPLTSELSLYQARFNQPTNAMGIREFVIPPELEFAELGIEVSDRTLLLGDEVSISSIAVDGVGGALSPLDFVLTNVGLAPLTIDSVALADNTQGFSITNADTLDTSLAIGESTTLTVQFDPLMVGSLADVLTISSNANSTPIFEIDLSGQGISATPLAQLSLGNNNNLGGVNVASGSSEANEIGEITNNGAEPLIISDIRLVEGNDTFTLTNIPTDLDTNPITLEFGESFTFGDLSFNPNTLGLDRAVIEVTTNDPNNPIVRLGAVGTGLPNIVYPEWGNDYIAIETPNLPNSTILRTVSDDEGNFEVFLPPEEFYHMVVFDPETGLVSHSYGTTPESGQGIDLTASLVFGGSTETDLDFDGLAGDIEFALGTSADKADTDGDGLTDLAELEQGLDPLGGRSLPIGIIAALSLRGEANEIVVKGSLDDPQEQFAYLATGSHGLAIADVSQFNNPILLGELNLAGDATDIAVDRQLGMAAVATNSSGLQLVDISNSMNPILRSQDLQPTIGSSNQVEVFDGIAYAASGSNLHAIELVSGDVLQTLSLGGGNITGIAREGTFLYTMDSNRILQTIDISNQDMMSRGSLVLSNGAGQLFVGNDIAYVVEASNFRGGYATVDVSDPDNPSLISNSDVSNMTTNPKTAIVANGSGLGLLVGRPSATQFNLLNLMDISDPEETDVFLNRVDLLPAIPESVAIASGIAFVADGSGGLQVVNYLGFDNQGQAPTITINTSDIDLDPDLEGVQVLEGSSVPIQANITDDVQVRNVQLLVNGEVVSNDVSFPFDLNAIALPSIGNSVTVQVRAVDTGGNATLSNLLTFDVVPDTFGPLVSSTTPTEGIRRRSISGISVRFNEAIDGTLLNVNGIRLTNLGEDGVLGGGDDTVVAVRGFQLSETGRTLFITPPAEADFIAGDYELRLDPSIISDRAGNPLEEAFTLNFTKRSISDPLLLGELISDRIFEGGEDQIFTFNGDAGDRIYFDGISADNFNLHARLVSPSGVTLFSFQDVRSDRDPLSLIETGVYQLIIDGANNTVGEYSFRLLDAQGPELALDTDIEGTLDPGSSVDLFSFAGTANQKLFFDGMGDDGNADFYLYGPANQFIEATDLRFDDEFTLPGNGIYTAVIRGFGETESVDYRFRLITPETTVTTPLTIGETVNGNISEPGEEDLFTFTGTAGQTLYYDGLTGDSSIDVQLLTPSGQSLFFVNSNSDRQPITLIETGTYQVRVDGSGITTGDYSFRLLDAANADALTLDEVVEGTLDPGTSVDLFTFEGVAAQKLFFDGLSDNFNGSFVVYGPANQFIASSSIRSDREFTLPGNGTYKVVIQGFSPEIVDYSFRLITPETTATTAITIGDTVNGNIAEPGEEDLFTFTGTAGQTLYYDGLVGNFNLDVQLISPSGQSLFFVNSNSNRQPITLIETGTYQVRVDGSGITTGDYSFRLLDLAEATELTLDTVTEGTLDPGSQTAIFTFEGTTEQRLFLDELTNAFNVFYVVYGPGNQFIDSGSSDNDITLPGNGTYFLVVQGNDFNDTAVDYRFRLVTPETNSIALTIGDTINSTLGEAGETDIYTFTGTVGQRLYFDGLDNSSIANVQLLNPNGGNILFSSTSFDSNPVTLNANGTYQLRITGSSNTGDYSFRLLDLATAEVLALDTLITRTLDPGRKTDLFMFEGEADQLLFFDGLADDFNSSFVVYGPANQFITSSSVFSDREFTLPSDGTYTVFIQGSGVEPVDYSFRLETPDIMDATLTVGETINGSIDNIGDRIRYTFTGEPGQRLFFDGLDSNSGFTARLFSPSGDEVSLFSRSTSSDTGPFSLLEPGNYELMIDGNSTITGAFSFRLLDLTTATETTLDATVTATLDPGRETDLYQIDLQAGQTILLDGLGSESGASYLIYGPGNQFITSSNVTSDRQFTVTADGTYTLVVQGFNDTPLNYSFEFTQVSFDDPGDPTGTTLSFGETVNGTISEVDEQDVYLLEATAGQRVYFDGLDNTFDFDVRLISPSGQTISSFFNTSSDRDPLILLETGAYQVIVEGFGNNTGDYSFRVFDVANATALTLGETVAGTLDPGTSVDLFTFTGEKNQQLFFDGMGDDGNADFYLYGPGNQLIDTTDLRFDDDITLPGNGTYVVAIRGFGSTPIDYSFRLINPTTVSTPLTLDETVNATITEAGETDIYTFSGTVGQTIYYDGLTGDFNIDVQLISPSGQSLFSFQNVDNDRLPLTLSENGVYQLRVEGGGTTGDYSFRLVDVANVDALTLDEVVTRTLDPGTSVDLFKFEGAANQKLFLDGLGDDGNADFYLYGPENQFIEATDLRFDDDITLPDDGTYLVAIRGFNATETVDYSFHLITPETTATTAITVGDTVNGNISEPGEEDLFTFSATAGQTLYYDGLTGNSSIDVQLLSPSGQSLFFVNSDSDGQPVTLIESGTYQLRVDGNSATTGDYSFRLVDVANADALTLDEVITRTLDPGTSVDFLTFDGAANQKLFFDGLSDNFNSSFFLYGPANQVIISPSNTRSDREFTLPGNGTYLVAIRGSNTTETVDYSFRLITPETTATTPITIGDTVNGNISESGEEDLFTFTATAGQTLYYDGLTGSSSIDVELISPSGQSLFRFQNSNADDEPITLIETGPYQLRVDGSGATTGEYSFRLVDVASASTLILDQLIEGTLAPGSSVDLFTFAGAANQQLFFDGLSDNFNGSFFLYGPANQLITSSNTRSDREFTLPGNGTYTVAIRGSDTEPVDYSFRLNTPGFTVIPLTLGNTVNGSITDTGGQTTYTFTGQAGQQLYFDGMSSNSGFTAQLFSPSGERLFSRNTNDDQQPFTLIESGAYELVIDGSGATVGDYSFRLFNTATVPVLNFGATNTGTLSPGNSSRVFRFQGTTNQTISLTDLGSQSGGTYRLYGPGNQLIISRNFRSNFEITLPGEGLYTLILDGSSSNLVDYRFRVD